MPIPRFLPLLLTAAITLPVFQSCQKEWSDPNDPSPVSATDDCPTLTAEVANLAVNQDLETAGLLTIFTAEQLADLRANTCLARELYPDGAQAAERASGLKNRFWSPGQHIRVRFLNGSAGLQQKVMGYAREWENYADVQFSQVSSGPSEVRVLFSTDGHWSYIGTDNLDIEPCAKTMNLQLQDNVANGEIRRVVLHEFGHVLGMRHEHQQPLASIPWNANAVYAYYAQQDWTREEVDDQVLNKNATESTQYTDFDAQSIMEYPVSASLTTNGYSIPWNTQLSATDKSFIGLMYSSRRIQVRHAASGYNANITFHLAGIYHTLRPGESLSVPVLTGANELAIWEQGANGAWAWDEGYAPAYGKNYKIVRNGSSNDLTLAVD